MSEQNIFAEDDNGFFVPFESKWIGRLDNTQLFKHINGDWKYNSAIGFQIIYDECCQYSPKDASSFEDFVRHKDKGYFYGKVDDVSSSLLVKSFPFIPKTFWIDVIKDSGGIFKIKDRNQLNKVYEYYKSDKHFFK